jgi:DNA-binding response OmpR family regulator
MAASWDLRQLLTARKENPQQDDAESEGEVLEVGDFRIDTHRRTATLRGEPLELTGEEFDVLLFLTTNRQRVVTPQTKLTTRTRTRTHQTQFLRVLMSLGKKLENAATGQQYLRTESWVIYRFEPVSSPPR